MASNRGGAAVTDENMRNELQDIQCKINATTDESLDSTRRMVQLCEESKDVAVQTLVMLDEQGEQLDRIGEGMYQINQDMKDAEKNLQGLEKCCSHCVLPWKRAENFEKSGTYNNAWKKNDDGKLDQTDGPRVVVGDQGQVPQGGYITRVTNDASEDDMDENLVAVSGMMGNLRNMAIDMNSEITSQSIQLDRITCTAYLNDDRIKQANQHANKLLKD